MSGKRPARAQLPVGLESGTGQSGLAKVMTTARPKTGNLLPGDSWGSGCRKDEGNRSSEEILGADPRGRDACFSPNPQTLAAWTTVSLCTGPGPCSGCYSGDTNVQGSPGPPSGRSSHLLPALNPGYCQVVSASAESPVWMLHTSGVL